MIRLVFIILTFTFAIMISDKDNMDESTITEDDWIKRYREISGNQTPPLKYKEWIKIATDLNCSTDPADYKQIFEDLKTYKDMNLSVEKVKKLNEKMLQMGKPVTGKDKETFLRTRFMWPYLNSLFYLPQVLDPAVDFYAITQIYDEGMVAPADDDQTRPYTDMSDLVNRCQAVRDAHKGHLGSNMFFKAPCSFIAVQFDVPVFSPNRLKGFKDILLPSEKTGLPAYASQYQVALDAPVWEEKVTNAAFRGRTTGINFKKVRQENIPLTENVRFKLHKMSMKQKSDELNCSVPLDFGLTEIWQCFEDSNYIEEVKRQFPLVPVLDYATQFKSKYLVVVDGNGWPDRIANFMLSGSLLFLATVHDEWVINQLVDGVNYIKVKPDLSDLIEKLEWAAKNDAEAKRIATNGRETAMKKFGLHPMQVYNALLFMEYQRLFSSE